MGVVRLEDLLNENQGKLLEDKSKRPIRVLTTVIIVVLLAILVVAMITVTRNAKIKQKERAERLTADIVAISSVARNIYAEYRQTGNKDLLLGVDQTSERVEPIVLIVNGHEEEYKYGYYYVSAQQILPYNPTLNYKDENYLINYSTGEVINVNGVTSHGEKFYSVDDLRAIAEEKTPPSKYVIYINSAEDMLMLHQNPSGHFKLGKDIDMTPYATGEGWKPVPEFSGSFEGRGYTIRNLMVSRASENYCGLFGQVKSGASINNLKLLNVNVSGGQNTGAIAGTCSGNVTNCFVQGTVSSFNSNVGGAFGLFENGNLTNVVVQVSVNGSESVGGFAGVITSGNIMACSADCIEKNKVSGNSKVGGFVGKIVPLGELKIDQVYSNCTIVAVEKAGGFIGTIEDQNAAPLEVIDSYAKGQITACNKVVGGFVGELTATADVNIQMQRLYTIVDTPRECETRGGFMGDIHITGAPSMKFEMCHWEKDNIQDGDLNPFGVANNFGILIDTNSPREMRQSSTYPEWTKGEKWTISNNDLPALKWTI